MKKKLLSLLSLVLAVVMMLPVAVFADGEGTTAPAPVAETEAQADTITLYYNSTLPEKKSQKITCEGATSWSVPVGSDFVSVDNNGTVTALKEGTAKVSANDNAGKQVGLYTINVLSRALEKIEIDTSSSTAEYIAGTTIKQSDLKVTATYNDGYTDTNFTAYSITPSGALKESDISVTVTATDDTAKKSSMTIAVREINMEQMVTGISISSPKANAEFEVGGVISKSDIEVTISYVGNTTNKTTLASNSDIKCDLEFNKDGKYTFSKDDKTVGTKTITVSYADYSASVTVKVIDSKSTESGGTSSNATYKAVVNGELRTKTYKVGDKLSFDGITVDLKKTADGKTETIDTLTAADLNGSFDYTFQASDKGSNKSINVKINYGGHVYTITLTGLTITDNADSRKLKEITSVELKEDEYPVGYSFSKDDIEELKVKLYKESSSKLETLTLDSDELSDYEFFSDVSLEVLTDKGKQKSASYYRDTIQDDDLIEDEDGDKSVYMRLNYKYYSSASASSAKAGVLNFTVEVGEPDISYIYDGDLIAVYDDLEKALDYCNDDDSDWENFELDDVDDRKHITLRLGKNYKLSSSFDDFSPEHNIVIDLNGNDLTIYSDTFVIDKDDKKYTITVTNSSKSESKFTYSDKDVTLIFAEDDKIVFEYDKSLPGFYTVEVSVGSHGKVTTSPSLSSNKVEVGMGSDVKFTITPEKGYEIDTVKVAGKSVVSDKDNYSVNSTGVATYTLKKINKDTKVEVTFKETKSTWENPFSDVRSSASYYSAVEFVCTHELFQGTSKTTFAPNSTMTRAMFVTVLGRLSGLDDATAKAKYGTKSEFTDVSTSNARITYAVPYISWATENGLIEGYGDGTFGPENPITHQQMYVLMYRYAMFVENLRPTSANVSLSMSDRSSVADWASDAVKYAQSKDFLVYTSGKYIDPTGNALRNELAQLLEKFCGTVLNWAD